MKSRLVAFFIIIVASLVSASAKVPLQILEKNKNGYKLTIVGKTDPQAKVSVNNKSVHVYSSGCFGTVVDLGIGDNEILVVASKGKDKSTENIKIHHQAAIKPAAKKDPVAVKRFDSPAVGLTTDGAYLQYSNGTDRLGASKMGYLPKDICLKATHLYDDRLYRVQLSANHHAYIPKEYFKVNTGQSSVNPAEIVGNWRVRNIGKTDRLTISTPTRLAFHTWTEINPSTILIDIFRAECNSNWLTQMDGLGIIDYIDFRQVEGDVLRVIIRLKENKNWGYTVKYDGKTMVVDVKHAPSHRLKDLTIGLDAGHGGKYPGAVGHSGLTEKEINLKLVMLIKERLERRGAKVVLSRSDDSQVDMSVRNRIFRDANVDLAISIHNNAGGSPIEEMGTSTYYKHLFCRQLASIMRKHLLALGLNDYGLTGNFNFSLSQPTDYPSALLEVLFMSSLPDEEKLLDPKWQNRIADAVVAGIDEYVKE